MPVLVVGGGCAGRGAALAVAGAGGARRVLVLEGGDALLRLPARARLARNVPQHALDAAVAVCASPNLCLLFACDVRRCTRD